MSDQKMEEGAAAVPSVDIQYIREDVFTFKWDGDGPMATDYQGKPCRVVSIVARFNPDGEFTRVNAVRVNAKKVKKDGALSQVGAHVWKWDEDEVKRLRAAALAQIRETPNTMSDDQPGTSEEDV